MSLRITGLSTLSPLESKRERSANFNY